MIFHVEKTARVKIQRWESSKHTIGTVRSSVKLKMKCEGSFSRRDIGSVQIAEVLECNAKGFVLHSVGSSELNYCKYKTLTISFT